MSIANIKDMLEFPILGIIPEDDAIKESQVMKNSVIYTHPKSKAARTYLNVTRRMLGREEEIDPVRMGFIEFLIKRIGLK
jgi:septum formation inhibitor-activating ATPase MinD